MHHSLRQALHWQRLLRVWRGRGEGRQISPEGRVSLQPVRLPPSSQTGVLSGKRSVLSPARVDQGRECSLSEFLRNHFYILSFSQQVNGHPEPYSAGLPPSFGSSENLITAESVNEKQQSNGNNENQQQVSFNRGLTGDKCDIFLGTSSYWRGTGECS